MGKALAALCCGAGALGWPKTREYLGHGVAQWSWHVHRVVDMSTLMSMGLGVMCLGQSKGPSIQFDVGRGGEGTTWASGGGIDVNVGT